MESPSEPQSRVLSPWRGLLITASILSCWIQPMSAQFSLLPNPLYGEVNHSITLDIQGFSGQPLIYIWYRNFSAYYNRIAHYTVATGVQEPAGIRQKVFPNGSLLIPDLTLSDSDNYIVAIFDSKNPISGAEGHLTVYERTTKPNLTVNGTNIIENDTLVFTCGAEQAGVDILWFFNNNSLILNERMKLSMNNRTLTILSVMREDVGFYECEIRNPISSNKSDPITLTVNYGPDYIMFVPNSEKEEIEVKFKGSLKLECHVESYPPAQYRWQVNGIVNPDFSNSTYVIKNATWEDSGKYTCQAKNNVTNLSVSVSITIKVDERTTKPNLTVNRTSVIENDTLDFTCDTEQAGVDILWFFNNMSLILNERMKLSMNNQTLTILSVKREDIGFYECEIQNPVSSNRSDPITLTVNYGPDYITFVPNSEQGEIEVKFKGSLTLECRVESYPPAQYRWQINGTVNPDYSNSTYVIKNATWEDSGKYTCQAKNNVTNLLVSKSITVKVVERTTKPNLTVNRTRVIENDTLDFTGGTEQAGGNILWFFNNISLILNEKMKLSMNNQTLTILSVKRKGAGSYQCEIRNSISSNRSDPIILVVNCE